MPPPPSKQSQRQTEFSPPLLCSLPTTATALNKLDIDKCIQHKPIDKRPLIFHLDILERLPFSCFCIVCVRLFCALFNIGVFFFTAACVAPTLASDSETLSGARRSVKHLYWACHTIDPLGGTSKQSGIPVGGLTKSPLREYPPVFMWFIAAWNDCVPGTTYRHTLIFSLKLG